MKNPELYLRKGADRRLRGGHCWIYSNEIDTARSPLGNFQSGDVVSVYSAGGDVLASAYMEPQSLICARCFSETGERTLDASLFRERIRSALALRERLYPEPCYRLIYGDSDGLSGVVVDRYGDILVLQLNTAGIERYQEPLLEALVECLQPTGILLRADSRARREQELEQQVETVFGEVPDEVEMIENGVRFLVPVKSGQKTGWFYDHRSNRARLRDYVVGKRVLDVYSYIGGWGVQAASFGATEVCCVDSSAAALEAAVSNAALNDVSNRLLTRQGPADKVMQALAAEGQDFDVVVLDPPAFVQRRRDLAKGCKAYRRINELGMRLLRPGGILVSGSCSMHLGMSDLVAAMQGGARRCGKRLQILERGYQGADHPVHPVVPETAYLKAVFGLVTDAG